MTQLLWDFIKESKNGQEYINSEEQYNNLEKILTTKDIETIQSIHRDWRLKLKELRNNEFEKLHVEDGGFVCSGDDGFYMDFANWVLVQGEALFNEFQTIGHTAVIDYIKKHTIPESDYMFECMSYAFHEYIN